MEGRKVRCRTCGGIFYETTERYEPNKPLTGDMLRLCQPFSTFQWPVYDGSLAVKSTSRFLMFCCNCAGMISTTGKLCFVDEEGEGGEGELPTPMQGAAIDKIEKGTTSSKLILVPEEVKVGSGYNADNVVLEKESMPDEQFICEKCGKVCKTKSGLQAHQRIASFQEEK